MMLEYYNLKTIELEKELSSYKKIYLDTKYWLLFRDVVLGRNKDESLCKIFSIIQKNIALKKIICPISYDIFIEITKQKDPYTLNKTIELIDELSKGNTLISEPDRMEYELLMFILSSTKQNYTTNSIWTKLMHIMSPIIPELSDLFSSTDKKKIQKMWIDHTFKLSLTEMMKAGDITKIQNSEEYYNLTKELNYQKKEHYDKQGSFKEVFMSEIASTLDAMKETYNPIARVLKNLDASKTGIKLEEKPDIRVFNNLIYHEFKLNEIDSSLPIIDITAGIHASIRMDKRRNYKQNDFHDFSHAKSALPYFDYFFTEHSLKNLIMQKNLDYHNKYRCKIASSYDEILKIIDEI
jgi:hypothetical protein